MRFLGPGAALLAAASGWAMAEPPGGALEDPPSAVVGNFLGALERDERSAAQAMLADNAMIGVGDVGGPLTASAYAEVMRGLGSNCRRTRLERDPRPFDMPGRTIAVVAVHFDCVSAERPERHALRIDYLVGGERIVGIYMDAGGGLSDPGTRDR